MPTTSTHSTADKDDRERTLAPLALHALLAGIFQHLPHPGMKIAHGSIQIEVGENDRSHHAAIKMGRYKLTHADRINGLEYLLADSVADDLRKHLTFFVVEPVDGLRDLRVAFMRASEVECNLHEAVNLRVLAHVILQPSRKDARGIRIPVAQCTDVLKRAPNSMLDRRPEQVRLAVEVIIDESCIDAESFGDVLDRNGREVTLGKKIERGRKELINAIGALGYPSPAATRRLRASFARSDLCLGQLIHSNQLSPTYARIQPGGIRIQTAIMPTLVDLTPPHVCTKCLGRTPPYGQYAPIPRGSSSPRTCINRTIKATLFAN